jgi:hypothetical protein
MYFRQKELSKQPFSSREKDFWISEAGILML